MNPPGEAPTAAPRPNRGTSVARTPIRRSPFWWWLSKVLVLTWARLWLRLRVEGREHVPATGPVLLVANHSSYLDPPLVGITAGRWVGFLAQAGLARFKPVRWWMAQMGVTLIDRDAPSKDAIRLLTANLLAGECVGMYPEGTRTRDGRIGPFRSGVEMLVRRTGASVVPVGLDGPVRAFPRGALWVRPIRCVVRYGLPWSPERVLAPGGVEALRAEVARLARCPLRTEDDPPTGRPATGASS